MEEKIYVVSESNFKKEFGNVLWVGIGLVVIYLIIMRIIAGDYIYEMGDEFIFFFGVIPVIAFGIYYCIFKFIFWSFSKMSIIITDKRVYGTSSFGRRVDLPLDSITAVSTSWFSGITVSTASGVIKFYCIKNSSVVYESINVLLINRQGNQAVQPVVELQEVVSTQGDVTEELRKYKALLDDGIITKKEFEDKKKELLSK